MLDGHGGTLLIAHHRQPGYAEAGLSLALSYQPTDTVATGPLLIATTLLATRHRVFLAGAATRWWKTPPAETFLSVAFGYSAGARQLRGRWLRPPRNRGLQHAGRYRSEPAGLSGNLCSSSSALQTISSKTWLPSVLSSAAPATCAYPYAAGHQSGGTVQPRLRLHARHGLRRARCPPRHVCLLL